MPSKSPLLEPTEICGTNLLALVSAASSTFGFSLKKSESVFSRQLELAKIDGRLDAEDVHLGLLAGRDSFELVAFARTLVLRRFGVLQRRLHADLGAHERALLVGGRLGFLRSDTLILRLLLLHVCLLQLRCELFTTHRDEEFRRDRRLAEAHLANGHARLLRLGPDTTLHLALDERTLVDEVEHLRGALHALQ